MGTVSVHDGYLFVGFCVFTSATAWCFKNCLENSNCSFCGSAFLCVCATEDRTLRVKNAAPPFIHMYLYQLGAVAVSIYVFTVNDKKSVWHVFSPHFWPAGICLCGSLNHIPPCCFSALCLILFIHFHFCLTFRRHLWSHRGKVKRKVTDWTGNTSSFSGVPRQSSHLPWEIKEFLSNICPGQLLDVTLSSKKQCS